MITITDAVIKNIIKRVIKNEDYRIEIVALINAEFLQFAVDFFKKIVNAKLNNQEVTTDWYKAEFIRPDLPKDEIAINSGINMKTLFNMYGTTKYEVVLEKSNQHYDELYQAINTLVEQGSDVDITLTIKLKGVSVDLNINESLIVINVLAVKRAELRGGAWSSAGKRAEKMLMLTLCKLFNVPKDSYELTGLTQSQREVDFFLISEDKEKYQCEVKLMGKGNPESADATIARNTHIFVADTLSDLNKNQLTELGIKWVALRDNEGYKKFGSILHEFKIRYTMPADNLDERIDQILDEVFSEQYV